MKGYNTIPMAPISGHKRPCANDVHAQDIGDQQSLGVIPYKQPHPNIHIKLYLRHC